MPKGRSIGLFGSRAKGVVPRGYTPRPDRKPVTKVVPEPIVEFVAATHPQPTQEVQRAYGS